MGIRYLKNPLSALGAKLGGGRYNYIGEFEVLYVAPDVQTAVQETLRNINFRFSPKSIVTIEVKVQRILNLQNQETINELGIDSEKLFYPWRRMQDINQKKAYTQVLGEEVYNSNQFEGI